jgi:hypothetical protein
MWITHNSKDGENLLDAEIITAFQIIRMAISISLYSNKTVSPKEVYSAIKDKASVTEDFVEKIMDAYFQTGGFSRHTNNEKEISYTVFLELDGEKQICFPDGAFLYAKSKEQAIEYKNLIHPKIQQRFPLHY